MKQKLAALKHWMDTRYYQKNGQEVWDLYLQLLRFWGVLSSEERKFLEQTKSILLGK
jgi:hypothetical protein